MWSCSIVLGATALGLVFGVWVATAGVMLVIMAGILKFVLIGDVVP